MRNSSKHKLRGLFWCVVILVALSSVAAVVAKRAGRTPSTNITTSITISNNTSSLEIRHVYLSPTNNDNWSRDQLSGTPIGPGTSTTLNNVSCDSAEIKVIGEDQNGCFLSQVVACGGNATWTISNGATPDCGN